eukprot:s4433_g4.t1
MHDRELRQAAGHVPSLRRAPPCFAQTSPGAAAQRGPLR